MRKFKTINSILFILTSLIANSQIKLVPTPVVGTAYTRYHGVRDIQTYKVLNDEYYLSDYSRGAVIETYIPVSNGFETGFDNFIDNDNIWEEYATNMDDAALDAHWALGEIYDYFLEVYGRKSYDDDNGTIKCHVHSNDYGVSFWLNDILNIGDGTYIGIVSKT